VLEPLDLMARLAALVSGADPAKRSTPRHVAMSRARRLKRVFGVQIESCTRALDQRLGQGMNRPGGSAVTDRR